MFLLKTILAFFMSAVLVGSMGCAMLKGAVQSPGEAVPKLCKVVTDPVRKINVLEGLANAIDGLCEIPGSIVGGLAKDVEDVTDQVTSDEKPKD